MRRIVHTAFFFFTHDHFIDLKVEKIQYTVFGYKKESKIQPDKIFWSATPKLWVVSFAIFDSWPFYQAKSWKTQNTVFGYKKGSKIQSDKIFWSATPNLWVVSFATFVSKWPEHWLSLGGGKSCGFPPPPSGLKSVTFKRNRLVRITVCSCNKIDIFVQEKEIKYIR